MMQRILIFLLAGIALFSSCSQEAPKPTIPEDKMVQIMADLVVADAATTFFSGYSKDSLAQIYYKQVFSMHGTTVEEYENNLRLYSQDVDHMERMGKMVEEKFAGEKEKEKDK